MTRKPVPKASSSTVFSPSSATLLPLEKWVDQADDDPRPTLTLRPQGPLPPRVLENLRKLRRLDILSAETILSLIGQAPIDPHGIFGALRGFGAWAFQGLDFTVVRVLARKGPAPCALMRIDLLSDDVVFIALKDGKLVEHKALPAEDILAKLKEPGMTEEGVMTWLQGHIDDAVQAGSQ